MASITVNSALLDQIVSVLEQLSSTVDQAQQALQTKNYKSVPSMLQALKSGIVNITETIGINDPQSPTYMSPSSTPGYGSSGTSSPVSSYSSATPRASVRAQRVLGELVGAMILAGEEDCE